MGLVAGKDEDWMGKVCVRGQQETRDWNYEKWIIKIILGEVIEGRRWWQNNRIRDIPGNWGKDSRWCSGRVGGRSEGIWRGWGRKVNCIWFRSNKNQARKEKKIWLKIEGALKTRSIKYFMLVRNPWWFYGKHVNVRLSTFSWHSHLHYYAPFNNVIVMKCLWSKTVNWIIVRRFLDEKNVLFHYRTEHCFFVCSKYWPIKEAR